MSTERKQHWEQIYRSKSPRAVNWFQGEPALPLALIRATGIGVEAAIIDVGGGASVLVDRLCEAGYRRLAVLDISAAALAHARQRLGERAGDVEWFESDVAEFASPHAFALWHDRAMFHSLTNAQDRRRYVEALERTLAPGGHLNYCGVRDRRTDPVQRPRYRAVRCGQACGRAWPGL